MKTGEGLNVSEPKQSMEHSSHEIAVCLEPSQQIPSFRLLIHTMTSRIWSRQHDGRVVFEKSLLQNQTLIVSRVPKSYIAFQYLVKPV